MTYPIDTLYAWIVNDPSGKHGLIASADGILGPMQAVTSNREVAERMEPIALEAAAATGHNVQLVRFTKAEIISEIVCP